MSEMLQPSDIVGMSFWLMTLAMAGAAAFFLLERRRVERRWQAALTTLGVAMLVSALSYVNLASVWAGAGEVSTVYRFAEWQLTVPLLTVTFYLVLCAVTKVPVALFWRLLVASAGGLRQRHPGFSRRARRRSLYSGRNLPGRGRQAQCQQRQPEGPDCVQRHPPCRHHWLGNLSIGLLHGVPRRRR